MEEREFTVTAVSLLGNMVGIHVAAPNNCGYLCREIEVYFLSDGRDGEWDKRLGLGNPAADKSEKYYVCFVSAEQLQAKVTPKQATPLFVDKLTFSSLHL